ncbi:testis-expressed protein 10 homolog [Biomphalaria glabrata]|uniref:Testis-expressed protein 10 homolog n=1 Tax=Biomphalaria glabrata TaxID=6526 RepID=A0A9W3B267_BIOGL|nr:testis-expressed protein 10 homolog [Biomphalaria glabrata]
MAKSKKKRQQDFQKVKLKVGKKLPKGDNVTNLSFKTRQIKFTQKIKVSDGKTAVTRNNLGILDLLRQCDHHSSTVRVNALCGLKELWLNHHVDLLVSSNVNGYASILKKLSTLLIDNESVVRHSVINLFKLILAKLSPKSPTSQHTHSLGGSLFTYIHTYLCCAMNHIHEDIKLDALLLFDALLDTFPALMIQQTGDLLKNLVGLISAPAYIGSKACPTTQKLSLNPDSKLPAMKYRAKVLQRIKRTFMEALKDEFKNHHSNPETVICSKWCLTNPKQKQNSRLVPKQAERKFSTLFFGGSHELDDYITNPSSLETFVKMAIPVLLQCWKEAWASIDEHSTSDVLLPADSLEVMSLVTSIIQLMFVLCFTSQKSDEAARDLKFQMVSPEMLVMNYLQDFDKIFMSSFPYTAQVFPELSRKRKKNKILQQTNNNESTQLSLNLSLCDLMCGLYTDVTLRPGKSLFKIRDYIQRVFKKSLSTENSKVVVRVLTNVFCNPHSASYFVSCYRAALKHYLSCSGETSHKNIFYKLFSFMSRTWDGWEMETAGPQPVHSYERNKDIQAIITDFYESLPSLLRDVIKNGNQEWTLEIFTLLNHCCTQNCLASLRKSLMNKVSETLDFQGTLLKCDNQHIQNQLFFLISIGIPLSRDLLKQILYCMRRPVEKPVLQQHSVVSHLIYCVILNIRELVPLKDQVEFNQMSQLQHSQLSDHLRFLFSLQIGFVSEELEVISPADSVQHKTDILCVDFEVQGDQWARHVAIAQVVAKELANTFLPACPDKGYVQVFSFLGNIEQLWKQTFMTRSKLHVLTVVSLLKLFYETSFQHVPVKLSAEFYDFGSIVLTSTMFALFNKEQPISQDVSQQVKSELSLCLNQDKVLFTHVSEKLHKNVEGSRILFMLT